MTAERAVREVIGRNPILAALSDRRQQIADDARENLQRLLDAYGAGIQVIQLQLQRVDPPSAVIDAFNDVQRARADQVRARNEAEAYRNDILPRARGQAEDIVQQAEAYRTQAIDQAKGEVNAFLTAYGAYQQAPEVFSWRTYLDSMDELLRRASRVVVDASGKDMAGVIPYMPLGEPPAHRLAETPAAPAAPPVAAPPAVPPSAQTLQYTDFLNCCVYVAVPLSTVCGCWRVRYSVTCTSRSSITSCVCFVTSSH
jgi:modulator of FtsH protease HflK